MLPAVTAGNEILTAFGAQTAAGLVMVNDGVGFIVTTTGLMSEQFPSALLI